jgi:hypothetical protein
MGIGIGIWMIWFGIITVWIGIIGIRIIWIWII